MNKKGTHVDWVISMGIFIVYIISLFILLRPGVTASYRPTNLLDNLQDNFEEDTNWVVKYVPLFIRICKPGTVSSFIDFDNGLDWSSSLFKENGDPISSSKIECFDEATTYSNEIINIYLRQDGTKYEPGIFPKIGFTCFPEEDEMHCEAELGMIENIKGINPDYLAEITKIVYDTLKSSWGVPPDKDFAIIKEDVNGGRSMIIGAKAPVQADVFVRRLDTQEVRGNGETNRVKIYLQIW